MTSNQISAAVAREQARHDAESERLQKLAQEEVERNNKVQNILSIAKNLNESAKIINDVAGVGGPYQTAINQQKANTEAWQVKKSQENYLRELELKGYSQQEIERHNKKLEELQLRDIKHLEYQDQLTSIRDDWNRQQDLFENNATLAKNEIERTKNVINTFYAQLERAKVNTEVLRSYSQILNDQVERELNAAKTNATRAKIVSDYMSATGKLLQGINGLMVLGGL